MVKTRDYTPQLPRSHITQPVGLYSPNKGNMYLGQLSPHPGNMRTTLASSPTHGQMENILIQTLSPRGLKLYGDAARPTNLREPKSTQHQDMMKYTMLSHEGSGKGKGKTGEDLYAKSNVGGKKGSKQLFGSQHAEPKANVPKQTKYQTQAKKAPAYESVIEQPIKSFLERRKQYY